MRLLVVLMQSGVLALAGGITGSVVDITNVPITAARVTVLITSTQDWTTTTDAQGRFTMRDLPPGTYKIELHSPGWAYSTVDGIVVSGNGTQDVGRIPLTVSSCGLSDIRHWSMPGKKAGGIRGQLIIYKYRSDKPMPGKNQQIEVLDLSGKRIASVSTDRDGRFSLEGIPQGTYRFRTRLDEVRLTTHSVLVGNYEWYTSEVCPESGCTPTEPPSIAICE